MSDDWINGTLADAVRTVDERAGEARGLDLVLSVTEKRGIIPQTEVYTKRVATNDVSKYKVLQPFDIAYNPYLLWTNAVGQWLGSEPGVTSPVYECFRVRGQNEPRFWGLVLESGMLTPYFDSTAVGSIQRRRRTTVPTFLAAPVLVPPLAVQRRIVDLIAAVDVRAAALSAEAAAGADVEGPLFQSLVTRGGGGVESLPLGEVGEFVRGRRFTKGEYVPSGLGCIHYGQIHTHFGPVARQSLTFLPEELRARLRLARPGDVVIAATSEDLNGLGKATVWLGYDDVAVHDDCYIFRHRLDPKFASYVFASPWFQQQKRQYAGGTKVTRISGSDLARIAVPIPPISQQVKIGEALGALSDHLNAVRVESEALRQLRASMLTALLSRQVVIPEAYDLLALDDGLVDARQVVQSRSGRDR